MNKVTFFVAVDSYIIRKGIVSILKNLSAVEVLLDTDNPDIFKNYVKEHGSDFIIISLALFERCPLFFADNLGLSEKTILLKHSRETPEKNNIFTSIFLSDSKQDIVVQLEELIKPYLDKKKAVHSSSLSDREITILKHVATGLTNKQIADLLFLSLHTVTTHRKNISNKLSIKSVSGLTVYAIVNNIISIEDIENTTR